MQQPDIEALLTSYLNGTLTEEESTALHAALLAADHENDAKTVIAQMIRQTQPDATYDAAKWNNLARQIIAVDRLTEANSPLPNAAKKIPSHRIHFLKTAWFRYVAVLLLIFTLGTVARTLYRKNKVAAIATRIKKAENNDLPPGGDKAVLTLADGTKIVLDSASNGELASRGNVQIVKLQDGQLKFIIGNADKRNNTTASQLNTITTPRGGQYQLELPDGTHIWLNAVTSLTFPTAFNSNKRQVQLNGEAYFEVAKDANHPFEVAANGTVVEVLGTHFNVNAYNDEKTVSTTLLEGKVQVQSGNSHIDLLPGYQCRSGNGNSSINQHADTEEAVAWKNGQFQFTGADVKTIMRQIGRWYNVEVNYIDDIPSAHITGEIPRTLTLRQVMDVLKESGISVWLEDNNQLYVAPGL